MISHFHGSKYNRFYRDKNVFLLVSCYSPYSILWVFQVLTIFIFLLIFSHFILHLRLYFSSDFSQFDVFRALCTTRLKFIASNMRFHTKRLFLFLISFCISLQKYTNGKLHFVFHTKQVLSLAGFIFQCEYMYTNREIYAIEKIDTCYFDVFHYWQLL